MKKNDYGKISIIIPTYNRGKLIERSINSVLNQSYKNIEVIVVDDGSSDNTESIVKSIGDKRLKYIKLKKNSGACKARNIGIKKSTGDYIAFQDSDDFFHIEKLEKQIKNLIKNKSDLDFCSINIYFYGNNAILPNEDIKKRINKNNIFDLLCEGNFISTQAIIAKKEIFKEILFDESLPRFQDYDLVLRIAAKYVISFSKEVLVDLYRQDDSISSNDEKLKTACSIMIKKDYGLNKIQENTFNRTLFYWANNAELNKLHYDLNKIKQKYAKMENEYNNLSKSYFDLSAQYNSIILSKRWRFINKILNLFKR